MKLLILLLSIQCITYTRPKPEISFYNKCQKYAFNLHFTHNTTEQKHILTIRNKEENKVNRSLLAQRLKKLSERNLPEEQLKKEQDFLDKLDKPVTIKRTDIKNALCVLHIETVTQPLSFRKDIDFEVNDALEYVLLTPEEVYDPLQKKYIISEEKRIVLEDNSGMLAIFDVCQKVPSGKSKDL